MRKSRAARRQPPRRSCLGSPARWPSQAALRPGRPSGRQRSLPLASLLLLVLGACGEPAATDALELLDWPGRDGERVVLNAELRVEFDRPLASGLRAGSCALFEWESGRAVEAEFEVVGRFLLFRPALPTQPDLSDGGLAPDRSYGIDLHGVPRLAAITGQDGSSLRGSRRLRFHTLGAEHLGALVALQAGDPWLRVLAGGDNLNQLEVRRDGTVRFRLSGPVDPRTLSPATVERADGERTSVSLELVRNEADQAEIQVQVGRWPGWRQLVLPAGLEGMGGRALHESDRRLGVRGGS